MKTLGFVNDDNGVPRIQWRAVMAFVVLLSLLNFLGFFVVWFFFNRNAVLWPAITQILVTWMFLVVVIELRRQRILTGKPAIRFGLASMMWLTTLIAIWLGFTLYMAREGQREYALGKKICESIQAVIGQGNAYAQAKVDRFSIQVLRKDFSDDDLNKVINLSKIDGELRSRIATLMLYGTNVTEEGFQSLNQCPSLETFATSVGPFSEETVEVLQQLRQLNFLIIDESKFTAEQLAELRNQLPGVKINGR